MAPDGTKPNMEDSEETIETKIMSINAYTFNASVLMGTPLEQFRVKTELGI